MLFRLTSSDDLRNLLIFGTTTACSALTWMNKCQIRVTVFSEGGRSHTSLLLCNRFGMQSRESVGSGVLSERRWW